MNGAELLLNHVMKLSLPRDPRGLFTRRRAHLCWSFVGLPRHEPRLQFADELLAEQFYRLWFYSLTHDLLNALKLAVAAELTYRTFRAFPGAAARVRILLAPVFFVPVLFASKVPAGRQLPGHHPDLSAAAPDRGIWIITAITLLIAWYRVPVHAMHRAILIGFAAYLLIFTTLLNVLRDFGFENLRSFIGHGGWIRLHPPALLVGLRGLGPGATSRAGSRRPQEASARTV
jgi:hypothetical protein